MLAVPAGLRAAPLRGGGAYAQAHSAARRPLVHRRSHFRSSGRVRINRADASLGESGEWMPWTSARTNGYGFRARKSRPVNQVHGEVRKTNRRWSWQILSHTRRPRVFPESPPMTYGAVARSAALLAASWSRSSCCWATRRCRRPSGTWEPSRIWFTRRTMGSARKWRLAGIRSRNPRDPLLQNQKS